MKTLVAVLAFTLLLSTASIGGAQSQLQIKPNQAPGNPTLEIPVAIDPEQRPLDPTFVGDWCGPTRETSAAGDSIPENESQLRDLRSLQPREARERIARRGNSIVVDGRVTAGGCAGPIAKLGVTTHVVSEYAEAIGPREIAMTLVVEFALRDKRATVALSEHLKLIGAGQMETTRTDRFQITDLNYSPLPNSTIRWSGSLHKARPGEFEAWLAKNDYEMGGSDLEVPGAR
jgi:hypothetical protein